MGAPALAQIIRGRILLVVCSYYVVRNASLSVTRKGLVVGRRPPSNHFCSFKLMGFSDTQEAKIQKRANVALSTSVLSHILGRSSGHHR